MTYFLTMHGYFDDIIQVQTICGHNASKYTSKW